MPKSVIRTMPVVVDQHVAGLQVAMQDPLCMRGGETSAELSRDVGDLLGRQAADASKQRGEVFAFDQLHREEHDAVGVTDVEHAADGGMRNLAGDANFVEDSRGLVIGAVDVISFSATGVCRMTSSARHTSPMPPRPIRATIR